MYIPISDSLIKAIEIIFIKNSKNCDRRQKKQILTIAVNYRSYRGFTRQQITPNNDPCNQTLHFGKDQYNL